MSLRHDCATAAGPRWTVALDDGTLVRWAGLASGPLVLTDADLADAASGLLGLRPVEVAAMAAARLRPECGGTGPRPPALVLHSATPTTRGFDADLQDLAAGRPPTDVAGYLESRAVALAGPRDLVVGRLPSWREAAEHRGVPAVDIGDRDHYHLSHALLVAAARPGPAGGPLSRLVRWMAERPSAVVRLYTLDTATQIFLLWLAERAGLTTIGVDANSPVVAERWNRKDGLHPTVDAALGARPATRDAPGWLDAERRLSDCAGRLGMAIPVLPGYRLARGPDPEAFVADALRAADLLVRRHGLRRGCLKPCEAGDGARIVVDLPLTDTERLARHARAAHAHGDDHLLEAQVEFPTFGAGNRRFAVAPSGHIRAGRVLDGLTVQLMRGTSWEGNVLVDRASAASVGIGAASYDRMTEAVHGVLDAFDGPAARAEGCEGGLVTAAIDFGFGRVGGGHGAGPVAGVIDLNLSSHGAEYLRNFHDEVSTDRPGVSVATRVFRPSASATLPAVDAVVRARVRDGETARAIACAAPSWGMVAVTGPAPVATVTTVLELVDTLVEHGLAEP